MLILLIIHVQAGVIFGTKVIMKYKLCESLFVHVEVCNSVF